MLDKEFEKHLTDYAMMNCPSHDELSYILETTPLIETMLRLCQY